MVLLDSSDGVLQRGDNAPYFSLIGTDNKSYALDDFSDKCALLIIFMCNHCPYVKEKLESIKKLQTDYGDKGLQIIGINPNDSKNYPEDSFEKMKELSDKQGFNFIYLHDENQDVAKAYGAVCTPDPYLFNRDRKLVYHGVIDEDSSDSHIRKAIMTVISGENYDGEETPSQGCSIKWKND